MRAPYLRTEIGRMSRQPVREESAVSVIPAQRTADYPAQRAAQWQGDLWSARAVDWASYQEAQNYQLHTEVLGRLPRIVGQRLLDVGCGAGLFLRRAAKHGASVWGIDAAQGLVSIARHRLPDADIRVGDMSELPYANGLFDIVTGINTFDLADDPLTAVEEARRVLKPRGLLVATALGDPDDSAAARHLLAAAPLLPRDGTSRLAPFAFSAPGALSTLVTAAGFESAVEYDGHATWEYGDETTLLRGLMSAGPLVRAVAHSGSHAVTAAVLEASEPYRTETGGYRLHNSFRYVVAAA
jgi:SAM-dependent methyltransferase